MLACSQIGSTIRKLILLWHQNFLADALGSTTALADSTGTVQTSYLFEPFGNTTVSGSSTTNGFAYTGRELDAGNLYYYRARYYNPTLQRFIGEDPLPDLNTYAYVGEIFARVGMAYYLDPLKLRSV